jgi:hypothetical protein
MLRRTHARSAQAGSAIRQAIATAPASTGHRAGWPALASGKSRRSGPLGRPRLRADSGDASVEVLVPKGAGGL